MPLTPSMENYLKAIFTLRQAHERVRCSDIAERMKVTPSFCEPGCQRIGEDGACKS